MKTVELANNVFGALWARSREGDRDENDILRRLLGLPEEDDEPGNLFGHADGFYDKRFHVRFPEGFQIFRLYKGFPKEAKATKGRWLLKNDGQFYDSLNELNVAIGAKSENAWQSWYFMNSNSERQIISELRAPETIKRRSEGDD